VSRFWSEKSVLVAGGAGFVGSYLVEELVADGAHVIVADNLETGSLDNLSAVAGRIRFLRGDLREPAFCGQATRDRQVVMNLAARAHGIGYAAGHHAELFTGNSLINLNLLEAARNNGVPRFLVVSSSCVYPDDAIAPTPELPVFTGLPELANEGYGWSKRLVELQATYYAAEYGMQIAIVRAFNAYGARCRWQDEATHVIPSLVKKAMKGDDPMVVWGSGEQRRNFLHVRDFAWGMMLLTERHATAEPVNLGLEDTVSMKELVSAILRAAGREGCRVEFDPTKPEGRAVKSADASKLRAIAPEFRSRVSLEEGMMEVVEWYRRCFGDPLDRRKPPIVNASAEPGTG
jgi:nucleoside-diphosphate-sugar epimerase